MIQPTVGRVLHYFEGGDPAPMAAIIVQVHGPDTVGLVVFDKHGFPHPRSSVAIWQGSEPAPSSFTRAEWPPQREVDAPPPGLMDRVTKLEERMRLSRY